MRKLLAAVAMLSLATWVSTGKDRRSELEKQQERIQSLRKKLARQMASPSLTEEQKFLHAKAAALLDRLKPSAGDRYVFDRLSRAADDLLEASEEISEAREAERRQAPEDREEAGRALQRYYFRVQQAEFFATVCAESETTTYSRQSRTVSEQRRSADDVREYRYSYRFEQAEFFAAVCGPSDAAAYVKHSRALYQQGRSAYDGKQYRRARKLGEAAALVVSALERLAQARLSGLEPPPLK